MYRTIEVGIWQELWFEELAPNGKLLFFYLLTSTRQTPCGAFRVSLRSICHETNLSEDSVREAMADLVGIGKAAWWPDSGWVLLTRFYKQQRAKMSSTYTVAARKAAADLADDVYAAVTTLYPELADDKRGYSYPTDTLPPTLPITVPVPESGTEAGPGPGPDAPAGAHAREGPPAKAPKYPAPFEQFWRSYPRPNGRAWDKPATYAAWKRLRPDGEMADAICAGVAAWRLGRDWQREFIKAPTRFLDGRLWEEPPEPWDAAADLARASPGGRGNLSTQAVADEIEQVRRNGSTQHDDGSIETWLQPADRRLAEPVRQPGGT